MNQSSLKINNAFKKYFYFILSYSWFTMLLVSGIQWSDSAIRIDISILFQSLTFHKRVESSEKFPQPKGHRKYVVL